jgi:hypothetical protein
MLWSGLLVLSVASAMSLDGGNETVASATDRRYLAITAPAFSERSSRCCDLDLEITLRHTGVGPNAGDQFVLADQLARMFNERMQKLEAARTQIDRLLVLKQKLSFWNQSKRTEFEILSGHSAHPALPAKPRF